jgi:hypothetical protein
MLRIVLSLIIFAFFGNIDSQEKENSSREFYEDTNTGQIFTKDGPNRKKLTTIEKKESGFDKFLVAPAHGSSFSKTSNPLGEKLTMVGRLQMRGVTGEKDSIWSNGNNDYNAVDVNVRRARVGWIYQSDRWWGVTAQIRLEDLVNRPYITTRNVEVTNADGTKTTVVQRVDIRENRGGLQEANLWVNIPFMHARVTMGQVLIPFAREFMMSSASMINLERSYLSSLTWQFDAGVSTTFFPLYEFAPKYERYLSVHLATLGGHGAGHEGVGRLQNQTNTYSNTKPLLTSPMYVWRIQYNPFGGLVEDSKDIGWQEGDEIFQRDLKLSIGYAGLATKNLYNSAVFNGPNNPQIRGIDPFPTLYAQTTPDNGYGIGGTGAGPYGTGWVNTNFNQYPQRYETNINNPSFGLTAHTVDFTVTKNGWYMSGAHSSFQGSATKGGYKTGQITLGYNFPIPDTKFYIMPVFRYDELKGDFNDNDKIDPFENPRSYWVGLNFFGDNHLFKAQLFYQIYNNRFAQDILTGQSRPADANVVYFQIQGTFWTGLATQERFNSLR